MKALNCIGIKFLSFSFKLYDTNDPKILGSYSALSAFCDKNKYDNKIFTTLPLSNVKC